MKPKNFILDVDGVMTDGKFHYSAVVPDPEESSANFSNYSVYKSDLSL